MEYLISPGFGGFQNHNIDHPIFCVKFRLVTITAAILIVCKNNN